MIIFGIDEDHLEMNNLQIGSLEINSGNFGDTDYSLIHNCYTIRTDGFNLQLDDSEFDFIVKQIKILKLKKEEYLRRKENGNQKWY